MERERRVCRRGTGSTQGPCGGREQPVSVRGLGSQFREMCLMLHCKGNPLEGLGKRGTVIRLQFWFKKKKKMTKHLWLQLENELQWAKVWTRAVREHLELFCQQVWSLTGSGRVWERPWGSLSLCVLSLMGLCGPRASAETFTQACCSRVLSPWKGQVGLVLSLFMRQMIDTSWAQAPAVCFLP